MQISKEMSGSNTELTPLVYSLFWTFLNPLKIVMQIFNSVVCLLFRYAAYDVYGYDGREGGRMV